MTPKTLYDKHCQALNDVAQYRWDASAKQRVRLFPVTLPPHWAWITDDERRYFVELAKRINGRTNS